MSEWLVLLDAYLVASLDAGEQVMARGRCGDGVDGRVGHSGSYLIVTDRKLLWVHWLWDAQRTASVDLDDITVATQHMKSNHYSLSMEHLPVMRSHHVPAHRFLMFQWGNAMATDPVTHTELSFSRRETKAAIAIREQLSRRGVLVP